MSTPNKPLAVVIAALIYEEKILLIQRRRGDYVGLWGLPGGKIEKGEHLPRAALREIAEEAGIEAKFKGYLGCVSECLEEDGKVTQHFLLHLCELTPLTTVITSHGEGTLDWFCLEKIASMRDQIIPSDYLIIQRMVNGRENTYYNCVLQKSGGGYMLKAFSGMAGGEFRGAHPSMG